MLLATEAFVIQPTSGRMAKCSWRFHQSVTPKNEMGIKIAILKPH
jgi:hypothetical protein